MKKLILAFIFLPLISFSQNYDALFESAVNKFGYNNHYGAITDLNKCIQIADNKYQLGAAYGLKARCYYARNEYSNALENINIAINNDPNYADYHHHRGLIKMKGDYPGFCNDFKKAASLGNEAARKIYKGFTSSPIIAKSMGCN